MYASRILILVLTVTNCFAFESVTVRKGVPDFPQRSVKPPVGAATLEHRKLREDEFWRRIPAFDVDRKTFLDYRWQRKNSVSGKKSLIELLSDIAPAEFVKDVSMALLISPMAVRLTPYSLSLINWADPWSDPVRREFIPLLSEIMPDHPMMSFDSLDEQADAPVEGLTHRYPDKALLLALDTCPTYCQFCTRSYAIGPDTHTNSKVSLGANPKRWEHAFKYIESRPELEDIVISGGDTLNLAPNQIQTIGERLLKMPNIQRIRFASRGLAVMPMQLLTDDDWIGALAAVNNLGRKLHKHVCLHTHFNHANEITGITRDAMDLLFERGITVRNQSVLLHGVNDTPDSAILLVKRLSFVNIHPYYVYQCDMTPGIESFRTSVQTGLDIEKQVRGATAGFNTPLYVVDLPGGGGKRNIWSYEYYDRTSGISVYQAPSVKKDRYFMYFDPLYSLGKDVQEAWKDEQSRQKMIENALKGAFSNKH